MNREKRVSDKRSAVVYLLCAGALLLAPFAMVDTQPAGALPQPRGGAGVTMDLAAVSAGAGADQVTGSLFNVGQAAVGFASGGSITMHAGVVPSIAAATEEPLFTIAWTGNGDGTSWHDADNWNLTRVPEGGDDVGILDVEATDVVIYSSSAGNTSIKSLTCDEAFQLTGGELTLDDASLINSAFTQTAGTLTGPGDVTVTGSMTWNGGTMSGTGTTIIEAGATLSIGGSGTKTLARTIDNHGTAEWTAGRWPFIDGTFNNLTGGTFNASANEDTSGSGGTSAFNNQGQFTRTGTGTTTFRGAVVFNNSGTVDVQAGLLSFATEYVQTAGATILDGGDLEKTATPLDIQGGLLTGEGTVTGNVKVGVCDPGPCDGQVAPGLSPGVIAVDGNHAQGSFGALTIEIGGGPGCTAFDLLAVTGAATLDGTLNIQLIDGCDPTLGAGFEVMTYESHSGVFATVNGLDIGGGLVFEITYGPNSVVLTVVPEPVPGDCDGEGDVDLDDFTEFAGSCLAGPDVPAGPECECVDFDGDGDVDLDDFAEFQKAFTG